MIIQRVITLACVTALITAAAAGAQEEDQSALLERGRKVVSSLPALPDGEELKSFFEVRMGPGNTIGYIVASIRAVEKDGATVYEYLSETLMEAPTRAQIRAEMAATLLPTFEPVSIRMRRANSLPTGEKKSVAIRVEFGEDKVTIAAADKDESGSREIPPPGPPVIFAVEMLAQRMDTRLKEPFAVREFSANAGGAGFLRFQFDVWKDGNLTLVTKPEGGELAYQFWYDESDKLMRWTHVSMPVLFVRSTEEKIQEVRKKMGEPLKFEVELPAAAAPG